MSENRIAACKSSALHRIKDDALNLVAMNTVNSFKAAHKKANCLSMQVKEDALTACLSFRNICQC